MLALLAQSPLNSLIQLLHSCLSQVECHLNVFSKKFVVRAERLTVTKQEEGIPSGHKTKAKQNSHLEPSTVNV